MAAHAAERHPELRRAAGRARWFGWDPDPEIDGISNSALTSCVVRRCPRRSPPHLHFHHAYVFEWYDAEAGRRSTPTVARCSCRRSAATTWTTRTGAVGQRTQPLLERHRPARCSAGTAAATARAGWTSPRWPARPCASCFKVLGDEDVVLRAAGGSTTSACTPARTASPRCRRPQRPPARLRSRSPGRPPAYVGSSPIASYRITRSDGKVDDRACDRPHDDPRRPQRHPPLTVNVAAVNEPRAGRGCLDGAHRPDHHDRDHLGHERAPGPLLHGDRQGGQARDHDTRLPACRWSCSVGSCARPPGPTR